MGDRLANKIYEIVSTGELRRLENVDKEKERIIKMFQNIHGVGLVTAQQFYAQVCVVQAQARMCIACACMTVPIRINHCACLFNQITTVPLLCLQYSGARGKFNLVVKYVPLCL